MAQWKGLKNALWEMLMEEFIVNRDSGIQSIHLLPLIGDRVSAWTAAPGPG